MNGRLDLSALLFKIGCPWRSSTRTTSLPTHRTGICPVYASEPRAQQQLARAHDLRSLHPDPMPARSSGNEHPFERRRLSPTQLFPKA